MSDYSVFKVQIAKKGTKCCHSLRRKGLSFQVVADEKGVLGSDFKIFFEKINIFFKKVYICNEISNTYYFF